MKFLINHKYLSMFLLTIVIAIGIFIYGSSQKKVEPPTTKTKIDAVELGKSTREDVIKLLGNPVEEKAVGGFEVLTFNSASPSRPDQVFFKQNVARLTKEIISYKDSRKADEIRNKEGVAAHILYGEDAVAGFYLFIYPEKGLAYLSNVNSDDMLEIWHFESTDIKTFEKELAPNYSETPPSPVQ